MSFGIRDWRRFPVKKLMKYGAVKTYQPIFAEKNKLVIALQQFGSGGDDGALQLKVIYF
jgi:hypothetical protein